MPNLKHKFSKFFLLAIFFQVLLLPAVAFGQEKDKSYGLEETVEATEGAIPKTVAGSSDVTELIGSIIQIALSFIGIIFFLLIFYSGFSWMTAQGNSDKIDKAKDTIQAAAIGLIIVMAAYAITNFVFEELQANTQQSSSIGCCQDGSVCANSDANGCSGTFYPGQTCSANNTCQP